MSEEHDIEEMKKEALDQLDKITDMLKEWTRQRRIGIGISDNVAGIEESAQVPSLTKKRLETTNISIEKDALTSLVDVRNLINDQVGLITRIFTVKF